MMLFEKVMLCEAASRHSFTVARRSIAGGGEVLVRPQVSEKWSTMML